MRILLTGANGFIGRALYALLLRREHDLCCVFRRKHQGKVEKEFAASDIFFIDDMNGRTSWNAMPDGIDAVVHLSALVHIPTKGAFDRYRRFIAVNYEGTCKLAMQAARKGVKRFVFISSIGVNGSINRGGAFTEQAVEMPYNSYSTAKLMAEQFLRRVEDKTDMEVVILRPPLVYGPYVKANFLKLMDAVHWRLPLPFAKVGNKRSFIALENFIDAVALCVEHERAGGKTFIVSDNNAMSTEELIREIASAMGRPPMLFHVSDSVVRLLLSLVGKEHVYRQLWGDLVADSTAIRQCLGWKPPVSSEQAIKKTVQWYLATNEKGSRCKQTVP